MYILSDHQIGMARNMYERLYEEESMELDIYNVVCALSRARRRAQETARLPTNFFQYCCQSFRLTISLRCSSSAAEAPNFGCSVAIRNSRQGFLVGVNVQLYLTESSFPLPREQEPVPQRFSGNLYFGDLQ